MPGRDDDGAPFKKDRVHGASQVDKEGFLVASNFKRR